MSKQKFLKSVTALDTETTNLHAAEAEIVEVAGARYDGRNWLVSSLLLGAEHGIPPEASAKTHISNRMINGLPTFKDNHHSVEVILHVDDTTYWIAHNCAYDQTVLAKSWSEIADNQKAATALDQTRWICTYRLAKQLLAFDFPNMQYSLSYLRYKLDLSIDDDAVSHRAGDDTLVCAVLFEFLVDYALITEQVTDSDDLGEQMHKLCWKPLVYTTWPFGKNKGKSFSEIPDDYYLWALSNIDALDDTKADFNSDLAESVRLELEGRLES